MTSWSAVWQPAPTTAGSVAVVGGARLEVPVEADTDAVLAGHPPRCAGSGEVVAGGQLLRHGVGGGLVGGLDGQGDVAGDRAGVLERSEEHTSELQSPSVISYAVFCLKK